MTAATSAFEEELLRVSPSLKGTARKLTGNAEDAEDLVQDTVLRALKGAATFEPGTNMKAWLHTIMRNAFYTDTRKKRPDLSADDTMPDCAVSGGQEDTVMLAEAQTALAVIPFDMRRAVQLIAQGESYEDAAIKLGCPVGTVKSQVSRGEMPFETY